MYKDIRQDLKAQTLQERLAKYGCHARMSNSNLLQASKWSWQMIPGKTKTQTVGMWKQEGYLSEDALRWKRFHHKTTHPDGNTNGLRQ